MSPSPLPLPKFGELLVGLAQVFDAPGQGGDTWRAALIADATAALVCPAQRAEAVAATLLRDAASLGSGDHRGLEDDRRRSRDCPACEVRARTWRDHSTRAERWVHGLPGLAEAGSLICAHHSAWSAEDPARGGLPRASMASQVVAFADTAAAAAWALTLADDLSGDSLLAYLQAVDGRLTAPGFIDALAESGRRTGLFAELGRPTISAAAMQSIAAHVEVLAPPFSDASGRLAAAFGRLADTSVPDRTGHSTRVAGAAVRIAEELQLERRLTTLIKWAACLHDLGEIRAGPGSPGHALASGELLGLESLQPLQQLVSRHHRPERDPLSAADSELERAASVVALADTLDPLRAVGGNARVQTLAAADLRFEPDVVRAAERCHWGLE